MTIGNIVLAIVVVMAVSLGTATIFLQKWYVPEGDVEHMVAAEIPLPMGSQATFQDTIPKNNPSPRTAPRAAALATASLQASGRNTTVHGSDVPSVPGITGVVDAGAQGTLRVTPEDYTQHLHSVGEDVRWKWEEWGRQPHPPYNTVPPAWRHLPDMTLWVRTFAPGANKLLTLLYESLELFWPTGYGHLTVVLDEDSPRDHEFAQLLRKLPPYPQVIFLLRVGALGRVL